MQKSSSPNHDFDPKTSPNRFDSLRLGSSVDDATNQTNVMFIDPCSLCGSKKRRILTPQESRKKISIDPNSINNNSPTPTTTTSTSSSPRLIAVPPNTNNNVNAPGSLITTTPESKNNNNHGSSGRSSSPATAPLPPRPPAFRRSVSDPTPSSKSRKELFFPPTVSGEPAKESPAEKRWKKLGERLAEMKNWVNSIVEDEEDQEIDDLKDENTPDNDVSEVVLPVPEKSVDLMEGEDGDTAAFTHQCYCGKRFQFCLSVRSI